MAVRVSLITRPGCHLCPDARAAVQEVCAEVGVEWREVDIDADERVRARFADDVPVVIVDGQVVGFWRIDRDRLRSALV